MGRYVIAGLMGMAVICGGWYFGSAGSRKTVSVQQQIDEGRSGRPGQAAPIGGESIVETIDLARAFEPPSLNNMASILTVRELRQALEQVLPRPRVAAYRDSDRALQVLVGSGLPAIRFAEEWALQPRTDPSELSFVPGAAVP